LAPWPSATKTQHYHADYLQREQILNKMFLIRLKVCWKGSKSHQFIK